MKSIRKGEVDMDEMKIKLSTNFMRNIVAKLISKAIAKKTGYKIDLHFSEISVENKNGDIHIHANVDGKIPNDEFVKIVKDIGLD
jgi:hypothetical protein